MANNKNDNQLGDKLKDGLEDVLVDQIIPRKLTEDHAVIQRIQEILDIPFDHAVLLYWGDGSERLDPYFKPPEKTMYEEGVELFTGDKRSSPKLNSAYKDFFRERAAAYARYSSNLETPKPTAKPISAGNPSSGAQNGATKVPVPRAKPTTAVPRPKPSAAIDPQRFGGSNPFEIEWADLQRQTRLLEENPLRAKQLIRAAGRDPRLFGFM